MAGKASQVLFPLPPLGDAGTENLQVGALAGEQGGGFSQWVCSVPALGVYKFLRQV